MCVCVCVCVCKEKRGRTGKISFHLSIHLFNKYLLSTQVVLVIKNLSANAGDLRNAVSTPFVLKIPWRRAWQPTPVFLPGDRGAW